MKIIIINIYYNWVINLYIEYIFNFIHFLNINYPDVEIELINYNLSIFDCISSLLCINCDFNF